MTSNDRVVMTRKLAPPLPVAPPPPGFLIRNHSPADIPVWRDIQHRADTLNKITESLFTEQFGTETSFHSQRIVYLATSSGEVLGTSAGWFGPQGPTNPLGRVHWVAIVPEYQGRGLSLPLMAATLALLMRLGHRQAYLTTSRHRPVAMDLYAKLGFREISADEAGQRGL